MADTKRPVVSSVTPAVIDSGGGDESFVSSISVSRAGSVYAWGLAPSLGRGGSSDASASATAAAKKSDAGAANVLEPELIPVLPKATEKATKFIHLSCGLHFTVAVSQDGRCFGFGSTAHNRLGGPAADSAQNAPAPALIHIPFSPSTPNPRIIRVACGQKHTLAMNDRGQLWSWGAADSGLGRTDASTSPHIPGRVWLPVADAQFADVKQRHKTPDQTFGSSGAAGKSGGSGGDSPAPNGFHAVVSIACGSRFSVVATAEGTAYAWGINTSKQCGIAKDGVVMFELPTPVGGALNDHDIVSVGCGYAFAGAVTSDGLLFTGGANADGQTGHVGPTTTNTPPPRKLKIKLRRR